jgi:protein-S-isoprenylcysteine O-methyltransferase Ste14
MLIFVAVAFLWRPWLQFRRYGTLGILLFRSREPREIMRDSMVIVWFALLLGQAVVTAAPQWLARRAIVAPPAADVLSVSGAVLLFAGLAFLMAAQLDLGASWRIGIDDDAKPGLVTDGLYRFSRNPIYLGFAVIVTGYTLMLPTFLSLTILIGTCFGVRQQALREERYLLRTYGEAYRDYASRVGRFLPVMGKLR